MSNHLEKFYQLKKNTQKMLDDMGMELVHSSIALDMEDPRLIMMINVKDTALMTAEELATKREFDKMMKGFSKPDKVEPPQEVIDEMKAFLEGTEDS